MNNVINYQEWFYIKLYTKQKSCTVINYNFLKANTNINWDKRNQSDELPNQKWSVKVDFSGRCADIC